MAFCVDGCIGWEKMPREGMVDDHELKEEPHFAS